METLEVIAVVSFTFIGLGIGAYCYRQRKASPAMKQSPSHETLNTLAPEDPVA